MKKLPNDADRHIGSRIRARRVAIGMSQEKLGDLLSLTFQQVQKYEKGTNRVGSGRLLEIGTILQVPVGYFYDGLAGAGERSETMQMLATSEGQRLAKAFSTIDNIQLRRKFVELVETMSGLQ